MLDYRKLVVRKAWERFKIRLFAGARHVVAFVLQTTILFALLYFQPWLGDVRAEGRLAAAGVASVLLSAVLSFLWDLFRAPEEIWRELSGRVEDFEAAVRPKFSVWLTNGGSPQTFGFGNTMRSPYTGSIQSVVTQSFSALAIEVTNETATLLEGCEAYLSRFEKVHGEDSYFQSLRLQWVPVGEDRATVDIPSSGKRTLLVFLVHGNRVAFLHDQMPIQAVHLLQDDTVYMGTITLSAKNKTSTYVEFRLDCGRDQPPHFVLARRGFRDAEIIDWAPETFWR